MRRQYSTDISDTQWSYLEPIFIEFHSHGGSTVELFLNLERLFKQKEAPVLDRINHELKVIEELFGDVV